MKNTHDDSIILIGPSGAGKSTVANVFEKRGMPRICLDSFAGRARRNGFKNKIVDRAKHDGKNPHDEFNLSLIKSAITLSEEKNIVGVCDFGAGHAIFETADGLNNCKQILSKYKNVVLLLPCKDKEKALEIMKSRSTGDFSPKKRFIESGCYEKLATMTIYADDKTPEKIADEISAEIEKRKKNKDNVEIGE